MKKENQHPTLKHRGFSLYEFRNLIKLILTKELVNPINNIEFGIHYPKALHKLKAYRYIKQDTKNFYSGKIDSKILSLPIHEHLNKSQILKICKIINKTLQ